MVRQESKRNTSSLLQIKLKNTEKYQKRIITKYKNAKKKTTKYGKYKKKSFEYLNVLKHIGLNCLHVFFPFSWGGVRF